jgi:HlyD family secretion protein
MATNHETLDWLTAGTPDKASRKAGKLSRRTLAILAGVLLVTATLIAWRAATRPATAPYGSAAVTRADITKTISATGKLQAVTTVQVGTEVSGTVSQLLADFNQEVKKGQVIARLEPEQLQAQLTQAQATHASAQAAVITAESNVGNSDAAVVAAQANVDRNASVVDDAQKNYDLTKQLVDAKVSAPRDQQVAEATLNQAVAQKQQAVAQLNQSKTQAQSSRSQLAQARAQELQAKAAVEFAAVNLQHTVITAPIDGTVISRNVDVGQTVAASLQAPTLFVIANDLTHMQVLADIDEADVGQLGPNSEVAFTVDAYPTDTFHGSIAQIRLSPNTVNNVTTYTAVINVDNSDLKLKPGMTANINAVVARRDDVLAVPNAALRYRPANAGKPTRGPVVWRIENDKLQPVSLKLGLTDGIKTEVVSGDLHDGDRLAAAVAPGGVRPDQAKSPFLPSPRGGGRR